MIGENKDQIKDLKKDSLYWESFFDLTAKESRLRELEELTGSTRVLGQCRKGPGNS